MSPACGFYDPAAFVEMMESSIGIGPQNTGEEAQMLLGMFSLAILGCPTIPDGTRRAAARLATSVGTECDV
jgi:hypothetical protein